MKPNDKSVLLAFKDQVVSELLIHPVIRARFHHGIKDFTKLHEKWWEALVKAHQSAREDDSLQVAGCDKPNDQSKKKCTKDQSQEKWRDDLVQEGWRIVVARRYYLEEPPNAFWCPPLPLNPVELLLPESALEQVLGSEVSERRADNDREAMAASYFLLAVVHDYQSDDKALMAHVSDVGVNNVAERIWDSCQCLNSNSLLLRERAEKMESKIKEATMKVRDFQPDPLPKTAKMIHDKLLSLPDGKAMLGEELLNWLGEKKQGYLNISQPTLQSHHLALLKPYGLMNKPRVGYYINR